ncbi:signal transduction histidine kinase [Pedobacter cryoconitis]|uniref:histidine kinase n=1 Tax=Pedobacter cryoconitis TaxID=188932 RepID=A0A7W8ZIE0_9SPHI|nr:hybrid sensor histidine kinase/response regulator [Pedobacter cryoconitis]MBB5634621.1 signal transduction histidine kinase [Pedobacter cryoconitis]MBB6272249.1 signal transduction histidine kinase [Pedobacter cryoconitis]
MTRSPVKVLYIDDEENNLLAFKASFRRQYEIYTAISAAEGLKVLENLSVEVIIADQKMPETTGVEFFKSIATTYPDPIRILLTGYTDIAALADAINHGDIYRYITKPWNDLELHNSIKNAHDAYRSKIDLRNKIKELEKTNDELNRFIYSISHELRAPLVSVIGIVNLVKMEGLYNSSGEYWELIESCSNKLDYYIQKTLQYYKNNKNVSENSDIDFKKLVDEMIDLYAYSDRDTQFNLNINQTHPFKGDSFRIEVILGNLISNAIKYQKESGHHKVVDITIEANLLSAEISITDNGLGILNEHLEKIFTQFFKAKNNKGSGLGLFIVKEALNKIDGTIAVSSSLNQGTTFKITIPNAK